MRNENQDKFINTSKMVSINALLANYVHNIYMSSKYYSIQTKLIKS